MTRDAKAGAKANAESGARSDITSDIKTNAKPNVEMKKAPNDIDRQVGAQVRMRRILIGMSQDKLAGAIGLTFQQVQKYEKGTNRISASRLQQIAVALGVSIDFLYGGSGDAVPGQAGFAEAPGTPYTADVFTSEGLRLLKAFNEISDPRVRRRLVDLAQALAASAKAETDSRGRSA